MGGTITCLGFLFFFQCEGPPPTPPVDTYCQNYKPIRISPKDTRETKEQADINNRRWKAVCVPKTQ